MLNNDDDDPLGPKIPSPLKLGLPPGLMLRLFFDLDGVPSWCSGKDGMGEPNSEGGDDNDGDGDDDRPNEDGVEECLLSIRVAAGVFGIGEA